MILACALGHRFEGKKRDAGRPCPTCRMPLEQTTAVAAELMLTADEHDMLANSTRCASCGHLEVLHYYDNEDGRLCLVHAGGAGCGCL